MLKLYRSYFAVIILALFANGATAQSLTGPDLQRALAKPRLVMPALTQGSAGTGSRDSLWNGTLIGLGAGIGATMALDAVFCDNGFGGCDTPWAAYVTLGLIGASAGAGIDFLIGRNRTADASEAGKATVRLAPVVGRERKGMVASVRF
jgi:hypothetical protein